MSRILLRLLAVSLLLTCAAAAQTSPFLPQELYDKLNNELSGDRAYDSLRELTKYHSPNGAGRGFKAEAEWIAAQAKLAGLEEVKIHSLPYDGEAWAPLAAELWLLEPAAEGKPARQVKLMDYPEIGTAVADHSRPVDTEADLIDVGPGLDEKDYAGKDVKGKIVLASGRPGSVEEEAVWKRGALGIVSWWSSRINPSDYPDQVPWGSVNDERAAKKEGKQPSFAIMLSWRQGNALHERLTLRRVPDPAGKEHPWKLDRETLRVRVHIASEVAPDATQGLVEGWIRGAKTGAASKDQQVVLTAHIQEERFSANDDRSGCANVLEIARTLVKLISEGKLARPERDIRFWWANEIDAEYTYFGVHPEERAKIFVDINQDMVGANQTVGGLSRVQHVTRTPWSRPTFFNDVVESVVMSLYYGNNAYLAPRAGSALAAGSPYTRPIYSHLGSRDRYAVEIVPFFTQSDHMVFSDGAIGTTHGGITFTNWPDEYIHSSDDDMWQMDRTQFKRNALAVTALAWFMANAQGGRDAIELLSAVKLGGLRRMAADLSNAKNALGKEATRADIDQVVEQSAKREMAAAESVQSIGNVPDVAQKFIEATRQDLRDFSVKVSSLIMARNSPPSPPPAEMGRVPVPIANLADYMKKREDLKRVPGLHSYMRYEALNFMDGKRSVWDIYAATRAESLAAGEWYYGKVTAEMVRQLFDNAATAGMITWKEAAAAPAPAKKKKP